MTDGLHFLRTPSQSAPNSTSPELPSLGPVPGAHFRRRKHATVRQTVTRNTAANVIYFGLQTVSVLVSLPFLLDRYGAVEYGLYIALMGIVILLQFLNIGLVIALTKYVAEFKAKSDALAMQALISNSYAISFSINLAAAAILMAIGAVGPALLNVPAAQRHLFLMLALILSVTSLPLGVLQVSRGILTGLQEFGLQVKLDMFNVLSPLIAVAWTAIADTSIVVWVFVSQAATIFSGILLFFAARRRLPEISHGPKLYRAEFRQILAFNSYQALNQMSAVLFYASDRLVLQRVRGATAVTAYAIVERPRLLCDSIVSLPLAALVPAMSQAHAEADSALIERFLTTGTRVYLRLVLPPLVLALALMPLSLRFWVGPSYSHLAGYAQLFFVALIAATPFKVFSHLMLSKARVKEIVLTQFAFAPLNVVFSYILARHLGVVGVILPTCFFWIAIYPVVWLLIMRQEGIDRLRFFSRLVGPIAASCGCGVTVALVQSQLHFNRILPFFGFACSGLALSYVVVLVTNRDAYERHLLAELAQRNIPFMARLWRR